MSDKDYEGRVTLLTVKETTRKEKTNEESIDDGGGLPYVRNDVRGGAMHGKDPRRIAVQARGR